MIIANIGIIFTWLFLVHYFKIFYSKIISDSQKSYKNSTKNLYTLHRDPPNVLHKHYTYINIYTHTYNTHYVRVFMSIKIFFLKYLRVSCISNSHLLLNTSVGIFKNDTLFCNHSSYSENKQWYHYTISSIDLIQMSSIVHNMSFTLKEKIMFLPSRIQFRITECL